MKEYVRWQFWAPRVLAIVVALLAVQYALCLLTRGRIERSIEAKLGVKSGLKAARVSFTDGRVILGGLQVADPLRPDRSLVEVHLCDLNMYWEALLGERAYDGQGRIAGLRLLSPRPSNGPLTTVPRTSGVTLAFGEPESEQLSQWINQLSTQFGRDWTHQFPSLAMTNELAARSGEQSAALFARWKGLQDRANELHARATAAEQNPLRNQAFFAAVPGEILALERDMAALTAEGNRLPDTLDTGRRAIVAARGQDEQFARQCLSAETPDGQVLASYLLREQVRNFLSQSLDWLRYARQIVPADARRASAARRRGEDIAFPGCRRSPDLRLRMLALAGSIHIAGTSVQVQGGLEDFTTEPWLLDRPMQLRLSSTGSPAIHVRLTIDRSGVVARDELLVDCRELTLPAFELGQADGVQLNISPAPAAFNVSLRLVGDDLSGDVQIVHSEAQVQVTAAKSLDAVPLETHLQDTLGTVGGFATRLSLSGTVDEPRCSLWSNLGPAASAAFDVAVERARADRARTLTLVAQRRVDEQLARIERQFSEGQSSLVADMATASGNLQKLATQCTEPQRLNIERLGRLPAHSLFR
jgi:uncharacterized protein (TIGR03545 family)